MGTLGSTLPIYGSLIKRTTAAIERATHLLPFSQEIRKKINEYFDDALKKSVYFNATILDPRLKLEPLKHYANFESIKSDFVLAAESKYTNPEDDDDWISSSLFKKRKVSSTESETLKYLREDVISEDEDPLVYWKRRETSSPFLAEMAKIYLAVPATSTPSERAFSQGRLLLRYSRSRQNSQHIRALICLKSWSNSNIFRI